MKKICIVHHSVSGSTAEMADLMARELSGDFDVRVCGVDGYEGGGPYDAFILGSPMRFGAFTGKMKKFIRKRKSDFAGAQLFCYYSLLYVARVEGEGDTGADCYIDPSFPSGLIPKGKTTVMDRTHTVGYYMKKTGPLFAGMRLRGIAFLNGRLDMKRLGLTARLFMIMITTFTKKERPGDFINPAAVKEWAKRLSGAI